ncbi:MAG: tetratricopeptide repeat protein [Nitrospinae bacterium]|nr:tetratricopeptide repeat protein [Nitrospinota bacterium]
MICKDRTEVKSQMSVFCRLSSVLWFLAAYCLLPTAYCFAEDSLLKEPAKLIKKGDYNNAIQILDYIKDRHEGTIWEKRTHYLLGHAYLKLAMSQSPAPETGSEEWKANQSVLFDDALKYLKKASEEYPPLSDYSEYNIAKIYFERGEYSSAIDTLNSILLKYPLTRLKARIKFDIAKTFFMLKNQPPLSLLLYKEGNGVVTEIKNFITEFPADEKIAEAYYLLGQTFEGMGNKLDAYSAYQFIYYNYPFDPFLEMALSRILELKKDNSVKFPPPEKKDEIKRIEGLMNGKNYNKVIKELADILERWKDDPLRETALFNLALSYKYIGDDSKCIENIRKFIKYFPKSPKVAEGLYMMSKIYWNKGNTKKAIPFNDIIISRYPKNAWAGRAIYVKARIKEEDDKSDDAITLYSRLINFSGLGELSEEAAWRIGWIYYQKKDYLKAIENFKKCAELFPDSQYADSSLYWMGRAGENSGNSEIAIDAYQRLALYYPYTYYGHRGYERLIALTPQSNNQLSVISYQPFDINNQLSGNWEFSNEGKFHIEKANELIDMGFIEDAREEIKSIPLSNGNNNMPALLSISQFYSRAEAYQDSMSIQNNILSKLKREEQNKLPEEFWRLYYPLSYWDFISKSVSENHIDPFLILSVMRQESAFNKMSLSSANAYGLMQLIPKTGERIYRMKWGGEFKNEVLFEPEINIEMGISYISELLQMYKNNPSLSPRQALILTLATYNAGPTAVKTWIEKFGTLPEDEFIEKITYPETRGYVKKVLRNYENYKRLYGTEQ